MFLVVKVIKMIESIYVAYNQLIETFKIIAFIVTTIPLFYYMFKLFYKVIKSILDKD